MNNTEQPQYKYLQQSFPRNYNMLGEYSNTLKVSPYFPLNGFTGNLITMNEPSNYPGFEYPASLIPYYYCSRYPEIESCNFYYPHFSQYQMSHQLISYPQCGIHTKSEHCKVLPPRSTLSNKNIPSNPASVQNEPNSEKRLKKSTAMTMKPKEQVFKVWLSPSKSKPSTLNRDWNTNSVNFDNSCKYRNVHKSIIRHMSSFVHNNKKVLSDNLQNKGFSNTIIEHAFVKIKSYKNAEHKTGNKKMIPRLIVDATNTVTVFTYILKDALETMLEDLASKNFGKLAEKNVETYKEVCVTYQKRIYDLLKSTAN